MTELTQEEIKELVPEEFGEIRSTTDVLIYALAQARKERDEALKEVERLRGEIKAWVDDCSDCEGTGKIEVSRSYHDYPPSPKQTVECPWCEEIRSSLNPPSKENE